ncbi:cytochrome b5, seed isoform-like [Coffea arabica]|uniref:Cytochrome b5, seed isoform-like n=1 Tax=Coffea arabica TaxID=13443 RepID=A0A6P6WUF5_COFAR|nr:cytochrome b5, seed isoform-like [Coffea arabica]
MGADDKVLGYDEVSLHNTSKDCWVIINAKAYDVTNFLDDHPGGGDVLLEAAGKDASEEFESAGHGSAARLMLDEYYVGEIDPSTKPSPKPAATAHLLSKEPKDDNAKSSGLLVKLLQFLLILGLAAGIHFFTKSSSNFEL